MSLVVRVVLLALVVLAGSGCAAVPPVTVVATLTPTPPPDRVREYVGTLGSGNSASEVRLLFDLPNDSPPHAVLVYERETIVLPYVVWHGASCDIDARGSGPALTAFGSVSIPYEVTGCPGPSEFRGFLKIDLGYTRFLILPRKS